MDSYQNVDFNAEIDMPVASIHVPRINFNIHKKATPATVGNTNCWLSGQLKLRVIYPI